MFVQVSAGVRGNVSDQGRMEAGETNGVARAGSSPASATPGSSRPADAASARVKVHNLQGSFSFSTSGTRGAGASARACVPVPVASGSARVSVGSSPVQDASDWKIVVDGAVSRPFAGCLGELRSFLALDVTDASVRALGAAADFQAVAERAGVEGVPVASLLAHAGMWEGSNVVSFASADGFVVRLPLDYVLGRASFVACRIDGVPVKDSEGCTTQLWIEGAPSHYAVRDVVRIGVERVPAAKVPTSPDAPLAGGDFAINPNIGVLNGILKGAQRGAIA